MILFKFRHTETTRSEMLSIILKDNMNRKFSWAFAAILTLCAAILTGCSSDDDNTQTLVIESVICVMPNCPFVYIFALKN